MKWIDKLSEYIAKKVILKKEDEFDIPQEIYKAFSGFSDSVIPDEYRMQPPDNTSEEQTLEDLTKELEKRDRELVRMSLFLRNVLDVQPDIIIRFDKDLHITFVNNTFLNIFKIDESLVIGKHIGDILDDVNSAYKLFLKSIEDKCTNLNKNNRSIEYSISIPFGSIVSCSDKSCDMTTPISSTLHTTIISLYNGSDNPIEYQCISKISCPFRSNCISAIKERIDNGN